jgi:hypothetical protein
MGQLVSLYAKEVSEVSEAPEARVGALVGWTLCSQFDPYI